MAKAIKTLSKAELKDAKTNLKAALGVVNAEHGKFVSDHKAAEKALAAAKKEADKAIAVAQKAVDAAGKKLEKATAAADKGRAKINAQLAALEPAAEAATA
ncbi:MULTISPECIES: hypothetical protein [unclassified Acidovorax]|uniref:hypothetical protein n=1 Tax=unclassified Acidovorax TaxID=2684926 RepID=UPI000B3FD20A|nr:MULTISPECIES: hypothetical protein [unclassified Acidovorax]